MPDPVFDESQLHTVSTIRSEGTTDPADWAVSYLAEVLAERGVEVSERGEPEVIVLGSDTAGGRALCDRLGLDQGAPEGYAVATSADRRSVTISGTDARGVSYGVLELADRVRYADDATAALLPATPLAAAADTPVRGVLRAFSCEEYDKSWLHDRSFWTEYLTELAVNRVNRFQLALGMQYNYGHDTVSDNYLCFPYPFLFAVDAFDVGVAGLPDAERDRNLAMLRFISEQATRRGMHFQLGLWNQAHDQTVRGGTQRYPITGLAAASRGRYCRAAVKKLLIECPSIAGITLRTHYEGGVEEQGRTEFWREFFGGVAEIDRPLDVDLHAKGLDDSVIEVAALSNKRVIVSPKYWAEHQGPPYHQTDIRQREKSSPDQGTGLMAITEHNRRSTRYGYSDFLRNPRDFDVLFRVWPGSQRVLLWGDPAMFRGYGQFSQLGGALGAELCEPLTFSGRRGTGRGNSRDPYADERLRLPAGREWRKYAYTYRLWGRLLHNARADPIEWQRYLDAELGAAAAHLGPALSAASRIISLVTIAHTPSASNNHYWPEMYSNLPIANSGTSGVYPDTPAPGTFGAVSPLDPMLFYGIDEYADDLLAGRRQGKYSPLDVADRLDRLAAECDRAVESARSDAADDWSPARERWRIDVTASARLGEFYAAKFRAGLFYSLYTKTGATSFLERAVRSYHTGAEAFGVVARITEDVYRPDLTFGDRRSERGHWVDRYTEIEADVAALEEEYRRAEHRAGASVDVRWELSGTRPDVSHEPVESFVPGEQLRVALRTAEPFDGKITLVYRLANQDAAYRTEPMVRAGEEWTSTIPADYTATANLLNYYFVLTHAGGNAWPHPGLADDLANRPYYVVENASTSITERPTSWPRSSSA